VARATKLPSPDELSSAAGGSMGDAASLSVFVLVDHGLLPKHRLLDIGCGVLRGGIPLIEYLDAGHYVGVEARTEVLKEARKELAKSGLEGKRPLLVNEADPTRVRLDTPIDVAWPSWCSFTCPTRSSMDT